jgi:hypothetical protein
VNDPEKTTDQKQPNTQEAGFRQDSPSETDKHLPENSQKKLNQKLDEALEETFPTSDPVSVKITK